MLRSTLQHRQPETSNEQLPAHIAIIMDGNGRWAKARGFKRTLGHKQGAEALQRVLNACRDEGITYLTLYAFSAENWKRPADEISDLMGLLKLYLNRELKSMHEQGVRLRFIGDRMQLSVEIRDMLKQAEVLTASNARFHLTVALSYGSRQELVRATRMLAEKVARGEMKPEEITEASLSAELYTDGIPEPDLLIRTGGEQRLSNFLLWQSAYTELYFTPVLWPDFGATELREAIAAFGARERRYGNAT